MIILGCDMEVNLSHVIRKDIEAGQGGSELEMNDGLHSYCHIQCERF